MSKKTLFCGLGLIGDNLEPKKNVYLTISDGIIQKIKFESSNSKADLQYPNDLLIPGFINAHVHIGDSFAKDQGLECSIRELVEPPTGLKHRLLNEVDEEVLKEGILYAIQEMLSTGTTTFVDFRESGEQGIKLLRDVLINTSINAIICGRPYPKLESLPKILEICEGVGLSSSNLYSQEELKYIKDICRRQGKLMMVHASETQEEKERAISKYKTSEIERAVKLLDTDVLIHITWANDEEVQLIADSKKSVVLCPRSNSHLNVGYPPVDLLQKCEVLVSLGSDNVMMNNLNLFREMEFFYKSVREKYGIKLISTHEILKMVTVNPAKALNLGDKIGSIEVGKRADFSILDLQAPNLRPLTSIYDAIVLRANPLNLRSVLIEGECVYER